MALGRVLALRRVLATLGRVLAALGRILLLLGRVHLLLLLRRVHLLLLLLRRLILTLLGHGREPSALDVDHARLLAVVLKLEPLVQASVRTKRAALD